MTSDTATLAKPAETRPTPSDATARRQLLARYRDEALAQGVAVLDWNPVLEAMLSHRSVRSYADRPLPEGLLEILAAAGQSAASSSNLQAWSMVAIEDPERRARLAALAGNQTHVAKAPLVLLFVADLSRLRTAAKAHGREAVGLDYLEGLLIGVSDASFASQNVLLAAQSLGLGGCYIGGMRNNPDEVSEEIGLPADAFVVFGLTLGYPDPAAPTDIKPRLPQQMVLHRERYQVPTDEDMRVYDERLGAFRDEQRMSETSWAAQAAARMGSVERLTGRHRLTDILKSRGFGLK